MSPEYPAASSSLLPSDVGALGGEDVHVPRVPSVSGTLVLDWDRERGATAGPRRIPVPEDGPCPSWLVVPHARYVLVARHARGRIDAVYVSSLVGKRDSLIPGGPVDSITMDDRSVAIVVEGRPYLYAAEPGSTLDVTSRRMMGTGTVA